MKRISFLIFEFFIISFAFSSLNAATRYVTSAGSGTLSGTSWANATNDLQLAINNSASGDEIWVAAGTYYPNRRADATGTVTSNDRSNAFVLQSGVKIFGGFAGTETYFSQRNITANTTILSGDLGTIGTSTDNAYHVVISSGNVGTAELNGFTITKGYAQNAVTPSINSNTINSARGGGIYCASSSPTLSNIIVTANYAEYLGGGINIEGASSPVLCNVTFSSNTSNQQGGGIYNVSTSSVSIENANFTDNYAVYSGGAVNNAGSSLTLTNILAYKNRSGQGGAAIYSTSNTPIIVNATIVYNTAASGYSGGLSGNFTVKNSIIWGNLGGSTSNNVNGTITYNRTLLEGSTLSGTAIIGNSNPRFVSVSADNYQILSWSPAVNAGDNSYNSTTTDLAGNTRTYDGTIDLGAYECQSAPTVLTKTRTIYVKKTASGTNDGSSWTNAFTELSDALYESDNSGTVAQIWVAAGTYIPTRYAGNGSNAGDKSFVLQKDVAIYGGFAGTESSLSQRNWASNATILSGNNTMFHVIISSGDVGTAVLDGFSIKSGNAGSWGNNTVNGQTIEWSLGGGIFCSASSPVLSNLKIYSNTSISDGAAIYCKANSSPMIVNSLIYSNVASQSSGGIFSVASNPLLINCTVANNEGQYSGAGVNGVCTIKNSIIWNNTVSGSVDNVSGTITYNYSLVQNGTVSGTGIISNSNPLFANIATNDYSLTWYSPAMNQGNNDYISSVSTDLAGNSRVNYNTVDLGAYEYTQLNKWVGSVSTDGSDAQNWAEGIVLADNDVLEFDPAAQRDLLLGTDLSVCYLRNQSSRVLNTNGHKLTLTGLVEQSSSITSSLAGSSVEFAGTTNQGISSGMFTSDSICNLIINNAANVTLSGNLHLTNNITATSGRLDAFTNSPTVYYSGQLLDGVFTNDRVYNLTLYNTSGYSPASDFLVGNNLTVGRSSVLTINPGRLFTVSGSVTNYNGVDGIVIKASSSNANGSFIFHNEANNPLNATVEMYTKAYYDANGPAGYKYKWQYFGIPLRTIVADPTFAGSYVRKYNEVGQTYSDCWVSLNNASVLTSLTGYEITQKLPKTISFSGVLENRDFNQTLSYTSNSYFPGQHVISNPYAAAINISQIGFSNMEQSVCIYNTGGNADWQQNYGTSGNSPGQYVVVPVNQAGVSGLPDQIPSMQGFMVSAYTGGGTINIPYNSTATKNTQIQRVRNKNAVADNQSVTIIDVKGTYFSDRMWIFTNPKCSHRFDNGYDGAKFIGTSENPQLYAEEVDGNYQVNTVDDIDSTRLSFHSGKDSTYTLTFTHQNQSTGFSELYLTDSVTGQTIDISQNGSSYVFKAIPGTVMHKRFQISTLGVISSIQNERNSGISIYSENNKIHILNKTTEAGEIFLYDNSGKQVGNYLFNTNSTTSITPGLKAGIYTLKASCSKLSIVKNIIIKD